MGRSIQLLDCTLRDGGNGLEELTRNGWENACFDKKMRENLLLSLQKTHIDIVEIGSIQPTEGDMTGFAQYQDIEEISRILTRKNCSSQMYTAMYRTPDVEQESIPQWAEGVCKNVRVVLRYSELDKSLDFCKGLASKGYNVFIQPMVTMRYTESELYKVIDAANQMKAYAVYIVDSYGCMEFDEIERLTRLYMSRLNKDIKMGFHAHNNMGMAMANAIHFIELSEGKDIIVDSCMMGMGLSAGNLQTELIARYLNKTCAKHYDMNSILCACEIINPLFEEGMWGYNLVRLATALQKTAYKYGPEYERNYGMQASAIYGLLSGMPDDYRYRFTKEYAADWFNVKG